MSRKNYALEAQLETWFIQIYETGDAFKQYIARQSIRSDKDLTIEQAIEIVRRINKINALIIQVKRATNYIKTHPDNVTKAMRQKSTAIEHELDVVKKYLCSPLEAPAKNTIIAYQDKKNREGRTLGYMDEIRLSGIHTSDQLIEQLASTASMPIDRRFKSLARFKNAVATVIEKNRRKNDAWKETYQTVGLYYQRVDQEVKNNVRAFAQDEYRIVEKQQSDYMKWLNVFESAMKVAQTNTESLFKNVDDAANWRAKMGFTLARGCTALITSPLGLHNFIDAGVVAANHLIRKIELSKGKVEFDAKQSNVLFKITGILPDPNSKTYENAYQVLSKETIYDKIARHKKYLAHKMNSLSESAALADMMSDDSKLWGGYTPDQVIAATRMELIDNGQYNKSDLLASKPEIERVLINNMTNVFHDSIKEMFAPIQSQYGSKEGWKAIHQLINKIEFNGNRKGADAHNANMDNQLVKTLANEIEIYFIVKYLHENTRYFGGSNFNKKLHRNYTSPDDKDFAFAHTPDNIACEYLVETLLKRIIKTDNLSLKKTLDLSAKLPENELLKTHPLKKPSFLSPQSYGRNLFEMRFPFFFSKTTPSIRHIKRQKMVGEITDTYLKKDLAEHLQNILVDFGKRNHIEIAPLLTQEEDPSKQLDSHWVSDNDLHESTVQKTTPYIQQAQRIKETGEFFGKQGLMYYRNSKMIDEVTRLRAADISQEKCANNKIRGNF